VRRDFIVARGCRNRRMLALDFLRSSAARDFVR
jgi:hypothetical protein